MAEECDDGNTVSGDGCSKKCKIEDGWECLHDYVKMDPFALEAGDPVFISKCKRVLSEPTIYDPQTITPVSASQAYYKIANV